MLRSAKGSARADAASALAAAGAAAVAAATVSFATVSSAASFSRHYILYKEKITVSFVKEEVIEDL